jgi:transposase
MFMKYIQGKNRTQISLFPTCLDDAISPEHEVRLIDVFVHSLDLNKMGFEVCHGENGRPAYHPTDLLKLYIYGYLNKIRSSRDLEKECQRNIEVMWLLNTLSPDHNTISNFRRDNPKAIKKVFKETVRIAKHFNLIGGVLLAGDSTRFRAQNSKKNNFNQKKIDRHLEYIENKLAEYNEALAQADGDEKKKIGQEIEKQKKRQQQYHELERQLHETGEPQVSTSDPESRQMIIRNNITEVAYNTQVTTDSEHNLPIDYKVTNTNDSKAMGNMLQRAKSILHSNQFIALYDKGYHTGSEFDIADRLNIEVMVAIPAIPKSSHAPDPAYDVENFAYNEIDNTYTCPQGHLLFTNGTWHKSTSGSLFRQFKTKKCKTCDARPLCTTSEKNGKIVQRRKHAINIEQNKKRIEQNKATYKKRQAIVEHPFGTIKRQWGFSYILTKKYIQRASADVGLMFTCYNLRRLINILGKDVLKEYLQNINHLLINILAKYRFLLCNLSYLKITHPKSSHFLKCA